MQFIVLSSSRGTTFQAVLDRIGEGRLQAKCLGLVTDRNDRGCVEKARKAGLPVVIVPRSKEEARETYDKKLNDAIRSLIKNPQELTMIAALGWMYILSPWFVSQWKNRILNVHPALLPKYPGTQAIEDALKAGDHETGMTIHLIDEGIDTGPILEQKICSINGSDSYDMLKERIQNLEKEWVPTVLQKIHNGEIRLP